MSPFLVIKTGIVYDILHHNWQYLVMSEVTVSETWGKDGMNIRFTFEHFLVIDTKFENWQL